MASSSTAARRRRADVAARSRTVSPPPVVGTPTPFHTSTHTVGLVLVAAAFVSFGVLAALTFQGTDLHVFAEGEQWGENGVTTPILILMVAAAPMFLAEYQSNGLWMSRDRGFFEGGPNDPAWLGWIFWIALGSGALALAGSLNAWRSGQQLQSGESVS